MFLTDVATRVKLSDISRPLYKTSENLKLHRVFPGHPASNVREIRPRKSGISILFPNFQKKISIDLWENEYFITSSQHWLFCAKRPKNKSGLFASFKVGESTFISCCLRQFSAFSGHSRFTRLWKIQWNLNCNLNVLLTRSIDFQKIMSSNFNYES